MGTSYGAYIVDSPPFTLDLDDIRAHLPDGWTISDGRPSNREGLQEYTVSFTYQATNPIQAERQWKAEVTLHDDGSVFVYRGWYDFIYFLEWYRTYLSPEYKLMASLGVLTGRGNYTIMPGFTWDTIDRELENVGLKAEIAPSDFWIGPAPDVDQSLQGQALLSALRTSYPHAIVFAEEPEEKIVWYWYAMWGVVDVDRKNVTIVDRDTSRLVNVVDWFRDLLPEESRRYFQCTIRSKRTFYTPVVDEHDHRLTLNEVNEMSMNMGDGFDVERLAEICEYLRGFGTEGKTLPEKQP